MRALPPSLPQLLVDEAVKAALLEDYVLLFKSASLDDLRALPYAAFRRGLEETLAPQFQIARSLGFGDGWSYTP